MEQPTEIIRIICKKCHKPLSICPICINEGENLGTLVTHKRVTLLKHYQAEHPEAPLPELLKDLD